MLIKYAKNNSSYIANDGCDIYEVLHPKNDDIQIPYSFALAEVKPNSQTRQHFLIHSEIYYILDGQGVVTIDAESAKVDRGDLVYIPPQSVQSIRNAGHQMLRFIAAVSPPWQSDQDFLMD